MSSCSVKCLRVTDRGEKPWNVDHNRRAKRVAIRHRVHRAVVSHRNVPANHKLSAGTKVGEDYYVTFKVLNEEM